MYSYDHMYNYDHMYSYDHISLSSSYNEKCSRQKL
jgi:hypothetical protein